jgi:hypothetical protein
VLFSGDTQIRTRTAGDVYTQEYIEGLVRIADREILKIYSGHDEPMTSQVRETILNALANVRNSRIIDKNAGSGFAV